MRSYREARKFCKVMNNAAMILGFAHLHFALALGFGLVGYGLDFDQLRSRSVVSSAASAVHDSLMLPHRVFMRSLPSGAITRPAVIPAALFGHSIAWGIVLFATARAFGRRHPRRQPADERI